MINTIPILGWILSCIGAASMAVPFYICWTICGIGKTFFDFLPLQWQAIGFWDCVGLFISVSIIKSVFVPKLATVNNSNDNKNQGKRL